MMLRSLDKLPVNDVIDAFQIDTPVFKKYMRTLEDHKLGSVDDTWDPDEYVECLWERNMQGNPWIDILEFCEKKQLLWQFYI